jgi:hypothetical protein
VGEGAGGQLESHPDEVWYRLSLDPAEAWKKISLDRRTTSVGVISDPAYGLYAAALPMKPEKIKDLAKFKKWLPSEFHLLYPDYTAAEEEEDEAEMEDDGEEAEEAEEAEGEEPIRRARSGKDEKEDGGGEEAEEGEEEEEEEFY